MADRQTFDFGHHNDAAIRLYLQHWMSKQHLGFLLHPAIPTQDRGDIRIMDIACGTGIWLVDLASQLPSTAQLEGCDISSAHFPLEHELPANVRLTVSDVLKPFPDELHGVFDVVHIGRIATFIRNEDPEPVLKNVIPLIKSGGYLQWDDLDVCSVRLRKHNHEFQSPNGERLFEFSRKFFAMAGLGSEWLDKLPTHFQQHGLKQIAARRAEIQPGFVKAWTSMQILANRDFIEHDIIPATAQSPGMPTAEEWRAMVKGFEAECVQGSRAVMDFVYAVGKKL